MSTQEKIRELQEKLNELTRTLSTEDEVMVKCGDIVIGGRQTQTKRMVCENEDGDLALITLEGKHKGKFTSDIWVEADNGMTPLKNLLNNYDPSKWSKVE